MCMKGSNAKVKQSWEGGREVKAVSYRHKEKNLLVWIDLELKKAEVTVLYF